MTNISNINKIKAIDLRIALLKTRGTDNGAIIKKLERQRRALTINMK